MLRMSAIGSLAFLLVNSWIYWVVALKCCRNSACTWETNRYEAGTAGIQYPVSHD